MQNEKRPLLSELPMPLLFVGETGVQQEKEDLDRNTRLVSDQFTVTSELQWSLQRNSLHWKRKRGNYTLIIKAYVPWGSRIGN